MMFVVKYFFVEFFSRVSRFLGQMTCNVFPIGLVRKEYLIKLNAGYWEG
jgi:hypothetical protein